MLRSGKDYLAGLKDGRTVYIGSEKVTDVTRHPAFAAAAQSVAALYDMKRAPENLERLSFEEKGERYSNYYLKPKTREDLERRTAIHSAIAEMTHGLFGRSPDHVSSFVTGMAMRPEAFKDEKSGNDFGANIGAHYEELRRGDFYSTYAVVPPQAARNPEFYDRQNLPIPTLRVVAERDDGVVISGMKMLATGAIIADQIWIGNLIPLAPDQVKQAITCAVPCNAQGLSLWSRQPFSHKAEAEFDYPLTWRFDETDAMVLCENVFVPWERVFVHDNAVLARSIYIETPGHCFGNHQSNVRFWHKMRLLVGLASRITQATGASEVPAVRETLGRLAALEATLGGMIQGQIQGYENWPEDYVCFNRRYMYAALNWCTENHSAIVDQVRELCGGGVFQMPASVSVMNDPELKKTFETYWQTPQLDALARMKLFRLAWDLVGSEFAGRHQQYEKFYAGASFIVRNHNFRETPWDELHGVVDKLLASYDVEGGTAAGRKSA